MDTFEPSLADVIVAAKIAGLRSQAATDKRRLRPRDVERYETALREKFEAATAEYQQAAAASLENI
jgi:hypothetical protein